MVHCSSMPNGKFQSNQKICVLDFEKGLAECDSEKKPYLVRGEEKNMVITHVRSLL